MVFGQSRAEWLGKDRGTGGPPRRAGAVTLPTSWMALRTLRRSTESPPGGKQEAQGLKRPCGALPFDWPHRAGRIVGYFCDPRNRFVPSAKLWTLLWLGVVTRFSTPITRCWRNGPTPRRKERSMMGDSRTKRELQNPRFLKNLFKGARAVVLRFSPGPFGRSSTQSLVAQNACGRNEWHEPLPGQEDWHDCFSVVERGVCFTPLILNQQTLLSGSGSKSTPS